MSGSDAPTHQPPRRVLPVLALTALALVAVGFCVYIALPRFRRILEPSPRQESLAQARRIYNACQAFAAVRGKLPGTLDALVPDFLADRRDLSDPGHPEQGEIGYYYYGTGKTVAEPGDSIFLASKAEQKGYRVVVRFNGDAKVQHLPEQSLRREAEREQEPAPVDL